MWPRIWVTTRRENRRAKIIHGIGKKNGKKKWPTAESPRYKFYYTYNTSKFQVLNSSFLQVLQVRAILLYTSKHFVCCYSSIGCNDNSFSALCLCYRIHIQRVRCITFAFWKWAVVQEQFVVLMHTKYINSSRWGDKLNKRKSWRNRQ